MHTQTKFQLYLVLLLLRLICAFLPGYIHPDEFFQSPEVTAGDVFDYDVFVPWEFKPELPARSIVLPYLTTGVPFELLKLISVVAKKYGFYGFESSLALFVTQRLAFFTFSLLIDDSVIRLHGLTGARNPFPVLLVLASSHVMLVYHTRSFSNAIESVLLTVSFYLLFRASTLYTAKALPGKGAITSSQALSQATADVGAAQSRGFFSTWTVALGLVLTLGFFSRITFVFYGFPIGIVFLYLAIRNAWDQRGIFSKIGVFFSDIIPLVFGVTLTSMFCVFVDSLYFGSLKLVLRDRVVTLEDFVTVLTNDPKSLLYDLTLTGTIVITPLNNLVYNLDPELRASHGVHPLYLHLAANLPLLFGPLALLAAYAILKSAVTLRLTAGNLPTTLLAYSGLCGVALLSLISHQEPRFLLPVLVPIVITMSQRFSSLPRVFWVLWIVFNAALVVVYGLLHQGGIVPMMGFLQKQSLGIRNCVPLDSAHDACDVGFVVDEPFIKPLTHHHYTTNLVFYKTLMPPQHLLRYPRNWKNTDITINVVDHAGAELSVVKKDLVERVPVGDPASVAQGWRRDGRVVFGRREGSFLLYERTLLIAPATTDLTPLTANNSGFTLKLVHRQWPHVNFDDFDVLIADPERLAYLDAYLLTVAATTDKSEGDVAGEGERTVE
ncbi:Alg9-like mannosyltransferase family-domain-containing protein [Endogone sp. FLAS-F59071]|nr:Alg9-like mannosyltransferase family-domain-containing protein [Endogone sp. FLAS-F59071]|eukprot:RUS22275.1 Alg9-like mannosyltransferase family-domain-containing protein [Endogone sp. FLAS-F59071]